MLGILKAGAAFVPLDSSSPPSRLREIIQQTNAKTIFVSQHMRDLWLDDVENILEVSETINSWPLLSSLSSFLAPAEPRNLAYIIFTSGSTGRPKGVMVEHGSYCSGVASRSSLIYRNLESRVLQFSSYGFDTSTEDILTTLVNGWVHIRAFGK